MIPVLQGVGQDLRKHGLTVKKVVGWQDRGRPGTWQPRGILNHHTASNARSGPAPALAIVTNGRPDLAGPLCNFLVARDGTIYLVAAGRCNHAGAGGPHKGIPIDSGNAYLIGIEIENDGVGEDYPIEQFRAVKILNAVLLRRMKRRPYFVIGHKEWTPRKIDPSFAMKWLRTSVRKYLRNRRNWGRR